MVMKIINLFIVGLMVAVGIYPVMHELAHSMIAVVLGARILEINIYPLPNVLCDVKTVSDLGVVIIGMSGMLLPYLLSINIKPKNFWLWYANYIVKGISALAFVISTISTISYLVGVPLPNDDTTQMLVMWRDGRWIYLGVSIVLSVHSIIRLINEKLLVYCIRFFDLSD